MSWTSCTASCRCRRAPGEGEHRKCAGNTAPTTPKAAREDEPYRRALATCKRVGRQALDVPLTTALATRRHGVPLAHRAGATILQVIADSLCCWWQP